MSDKTKIILAGAFAWIIYTVVVFAVPFRHESIFWICYGFTVGAILYVAIITYMNMYMKIQSLYHYSIIRKSIIYGIVQVVAGLIFMALSAYIPLWVGALVQVLIVGGYTVSVWTVIQIGGREAEKKKKIKKSTFGWKQCCFWLEELWKKSENDEIKEIYEIAKYSDPVDSDYTMKFAEEIRELLSALEKSVSKNEKTDITEICERLKTEIHRRNYVCSLSKNK